MKNNFKKLLILGAMLVTGSLTLSGCLAELPTLPSDEQQYNGDENGNQQGGENQGNENQNGQQGNENNGGQQQGGDNGNQQGGDNQGGEGQGDNGNQGGQGGENQGGEQGGSEVNAFPAEALKTFLASEGLTVEVPSPYSASKWTSEVKEDNGKYFEAKVEDKGTVGKDSIEDTYFALLEKTTGWVVDDSEYDLYGYFARKDNVEVEFYTENGTFNFWAYKYENPYTESEQFPAEALQEFLTSEELTTKVPSPTSQYSWQYAAYPSDDENDAVFMASTQDDGVPGTNAIEDAYLKVLNTAGGWVVDDSDYDTDGYYAHKGDVQLCFFSMEADSDGDGFFYIDVSKYVEENGQGGGDTPVTIENDGSLEHPFTAQEAIALCDQAGEGKIVGTDKQYYVKGVFDAGTKVNDYHQWQGTLSGTKFIVNSATNNSGVSIQEKNGALDGKEVIVKGFIELYNGDYKMGYLPASASPTGQKFNPSIVSISDSNQGGGNNTQNDEIALKDLVEDILDDEFDWKYDSSDDCYYVLFEVTSGTPQQNCTAYYNALITGGFTKDEDVTYYDDDGEYYYGDMYYEDEDNFVCVFAWDEEEDGETYHVVQISVADVTIEKEGNGGNGGNGEQGGGNGSQSTQPEPNEKVEWTIMIYMCGSTLESDVDEHGNLVALATGDIEEILSVSGQPNNVNIIIETGGASEWSSQYGISNNKLERWHVENKKLVKDDSLTNASMGKVSTFQSFLEWGFTYYPADRYGVFMWNHGGAMDGCCFDENFNDDSLTNAEVYKALTNAKASCNVTNNLEFIAYDACLMAVQDVVEMNSHHFNYMIASQESESGYGYDYDAWLPTLYANPTSVETPKLLQKIGETFLAEEKEIYDYWEEPFDQTQSVYDLSKANAYLTAYEAVASGLATYVNSDNWSTFVQNNVNSNDVQKYGGDDGEYLFDIFDAEDVLDKIAANYEDLADEVTAAKAALDNLVIWEAHGDATSGCGLNIFCPITSQYNRYYEEDTNFANWYNLCKYSGLCIDK